jgi:hypothetical protein
MKLIMTVYQLLSLERGGFFSLQYHVDNRAPRAHRKKRNGLCSNSLLLSVFGMIEYPTTPKSRKITAIYRPNMAIATVGLRAICEYISTKSIDRQSNRLQSGQVGKSGVLACLNLPLVVPLLFSSYC